MPASGLSLPPFGWIDQVVVAEQVGQVGIGLLQRDDDLLAVGLDALDALHEAERAGLGLLVGVALERRDHVLGVTVLPLWNSTPSRIFNVQTLASSDEPISSAMRVLEVALGRQLDDHLAPHLAEGERHLAS